VAPSQELIDRSPALLLHKPATASGLRAEPAADDAAHALQGLALQPGGRQAPAHGPGAGAQAGVEEAAAQGAERERRAAAGLPPSAALSLCRADRGFVRIGLQPGVCVVSSVGQDVLYWCMQSYASRARAR
jgi:hypothetical protein